MKTLIKKLNFLGTALIITGFAVYVFFTFKTPQTTTSIEELQIGDTTLFIIRLTFLAIYLVVWFSAYYCVRFLKERGKDNSDIKPFTETYTLGFLLLLIGIMSTTILGSINSFLAFYSNSFVPLITIVINYLHVFAPLSAFIVMWFGTNKIVKKDKIDGFETKSYRFLIRSITPVVLIGIMYISLIFSNPNRQISFNSETAASFYIPDPLIIITLVIPAILAWFFGIATAFKMNEELIKLDTPNGKYLTNGILLVIFSSMFLQMILSLGTARLYELGLGVILLLVYILLFSQMFGFIFTAKGVSAFDNISR